MSIKKKLSTSVVGLTIIRLPGNFLNLKDLVFMISILTWSSPVEQAYCVWTPGILDELGRKGGKREASVRL